MYILQHVDKQVVKCVGKYAKPALTKLVLVQHYPRLIGYPSYLTRLCHGVNELMHVVVLLVKVGGREPLSIYTD